MVRKIKKAAVIGSGVMGGGIAALLVSAGIRTLLLDIVSSDLSSNDKKVPNARNSIVNTGLNNILLSNPPLLMQQKDSDLIEIGNLEDDFEKLSGCDWIIEVVVENIDVKRNLFERIEGVRKVGSIVSSNTSGIPLASMSKGLSLEFRQHFLGTHFFNPVRYMRLLEIIPGKDTLESILEFISSFGENVLGKGIVWAKDTPNFIGNRIGVHGMVKTMQLMVKEDITISEVDALFGSQLGRPRTGMFKTADLVGLDVLSHVADNTYELVKEDEERESFILPGFVKKMVSKNLLGKKVNGGFYKTEITPKWGKIRKVIDYRSMDYITYEKVSFPCIEEAKLAKTLSEKIKLMVYGKDRGSSFVWKVIASNLIYSVNRIPEVADNICEIDRAMRWGFNFEIGPFEIWDDIGLVKSVEKMEKDGFSVPEKIKKMILEGNSSFYKINNGKKYFFDFESGNYKEVFSNNREISLAVLKNKGGVVKSCNSASLINLGDDIFCLEFETKMNAINGEIVDFMESSIEYIENNGAGLVIGNYSRSLPGAFSAGGDLGFMASLAKEGKYSEINGFLKKAQDGLQRIRYASVPVVAAPYGLTLGGGCEVCLGAADRIVAHCDLYMGLVEIGVGLLPSGGGCLNLWKKMTENIPDVVTNIDLAKFFIPSFMSVAMAKVSISALEARNNGFLGPKDRIIFNREHLIGEAKKEIMRMLEDGYSAPIKRKIRVMGDAGRGMINAEIFNMRSGKFISSYDSFLAKKIAFVMSGGDIRTDSVINEEVILNLEREAFIDFWKQDKTIARVDHMLKTGKPLRN